MSRSAVLGLLLTVLAGLAGSFGLYRMAAQSIERDQQAVFMRLATARSGAIAQRLISSQESAMNMHGLYQASEVVDVDEFTLFGELQHRRHTSVHALQWVPQISASERAAYEQRVSDMLDTGFRITELNESGLLQPAGERADYFPVQFVVPFKVNKTLLGFDQGSVNTVRNTLELARNSGLTQATPAIRLPQEIDPAPGILVAEPVYKGSRSSSIERQHNLSGFIIAVVRIKTVLQNAVHSLHQSEAPIYTALYDTTGGSERFLYGHGDKPARPVDASWTQESVINFAGRTWAIRNQPSSPVVAGLQWQPLGMLLGMLALSAVISIFIYTLMHREQLVSVAVAERTRELRRSEARIRSLLDTASNAIFILDRDGRIESSNRAANQLFAQDEDTALPEHFYELFPRAREDDLLEASNEEFQLTLPNGETVFLQVSVSSTGPEGQQSRIVVMNDVTLRRRMENTEREQKLLLQNIMQTMDEGLIVARAGHPLMVNPKTESMFPNITALTRSRPVPNQVGWLDPETLEPILEESLPIHRLMMGEEIQNVEYFIQNELQPDGVYLEVSGNALIDLNGRRIGAMVVLRDISHRKAFERKLQDTANELAVSNQELESFARAASHDLQEPLRKVQRFGSLLRMSRAEQLDEQGLDFLDRMINAADRMSALIDGLLSLARVTSKGAPFVPCDLNILLSEVLDDLQVRIEDTQAEIDAGPLPSIDADPVQMRQLFQNLIGNGLKYQPAGNQPKIVVRAERLVRARPVEHLCWRLTFTDNGIGFRQEEADRIFGVFSRLHGRGKYEGSGVGLSICRKIAERHHGEISATSEPGKGATFTVILPEDQRGTDEEPRDA